MMTRIFAAYLMLWASAFLANAQPSMKPVKPKPQAELLLKSGSSYTWSLPGLPETLFKQVLEIDEPAALTVGLPEKYDPDQQYPLVLLIGGGQGGSGHDVKYVRKVVGKQDVIVAALPLFLRDLAPVDADKRNKWSRMYISKNESAHIWKAWKPLLTVLFDKIPNIDRRYCFLGGFSNGANATAAVLMDPQTRPELLTYFNHFILVEGGMEIEAGPDYSDAAFLLVEGEIEVESRVERNRSLQQRAEDLSEAIQGKVDYWQMPETGHGFPLKEKKKVANWIREQAHLPPVNGAADTGRD